MTTEQTIPLNLLIPSKANIRRTGRNEGIGELAASIAAHGLRQNLNVQPSPDGERFEVVAGGRRLRAMKLLAKAGKLAGDAPVNCLVLGEGDDPGEISLVENTLRTAMHPDDQFEAFRALSKPKARPSRKSPHALASPLPWCVSASSWRTCRRSCGRCSARAKWALSM